MVTVRKIGKGGVVYGNLSRARKASGTYGVFLDDGQQVAEIVNESMGRRRDVDRWVVQQHQSPWRTLSRVFRTFREAEIEAMRMFSE